MKVLVVGGSDSGKSGYAEKLCCRLSPTRTYIATMSPIGEDAQRRIERHRRQRANQGFVTMERIGTLFPIVPHIETCKESQDANRYGTCPHIIKRSPTSQTDRNQGVALLDDVGNLIANALFAPDGSMKDPHEVELRLLQELHALSAAFCHVVAVGDMVGCEGVYEDTSTQTWVQLTGTICCTLAAEFDTVVEVVAGSPQILKGTLP